MRSIQHGIPHPSEPSGAIHVITDEKRQEAKYYVSIISLNQRIAPWALGDYTPLAVWCPVLGKIALIRSPNTMKLGKLALNDCRASLKKSRIHERTAPSRQGGRRPSD